MKSAFFTAALVLTTGFYAGAQTPAPAKTTAETKAASAVDQTKDAQTASPYVRPDSEERRKSYFKSMSGLTP